MIITMVKIIIIIKVEGYNRGGREGEGVSALTR